MSDILALARPEIVALKAYSHASWDPALDRLHANELPWRAGDRSLARRAQSLSRAASARARGAAGRAVRRASRRSCCRDAAATSPSTCVVRGFCRAGIDNVIICPPTFGMYAVAARIQGAEVREVPLRARARLRARRRRRARGLRCATRASCSCARPTIRPAMRIEPAAVAKLLVALAGKALVVVDEAYIEFSRRRSRSRLRWRASRTSWCCAPCPRPSASPARACGSLIARARHRRAARAR